MKQDRPPAHFLEQATRRTLDGGTMARKRVDKILLARRRRAEVVLQRGRGNRAPHTMSVDERKKAQRRVDAAIRRRFGRKQYLHDG